MSRIYQTASNDEIYTDTDGDIGDFWFNDASDPGTGGTTNAPSTIASIATLANYLTNGYWGSSAHHWASATVTVNIEGLTAAERTLAQNALQLWHEVANISFNFIATAASITFNHAGTLTASTSASWNGAGNMISATVDISSDWISTDGGFKDGRTGTYSYGFETYIHEIGHALGLGHQGPYNGGSIDGPYNTSSIYANDTWQYSIMSYNRQHNFGGASDDYVISPQMADIFAVQSMYGAGTARIGDTTYGFHSNAGPIYDFSQYSGLPAFTIYDSSGSDTLDFSGFSASQTINLNGGAWSSIGGLVNNIGVYTTSVIENAIGGAGNDTIIGNGADNRFVGGPGDDTIDGGPGTDSAVFSGPSSAYMVTSLGGTSVRIAGPDGTDMLTNVERLVFDNQTVIWPPAGPNHAPAIVSNGGGDTANVTMRENLGFAASVAASDQDAFNILTYAIIGGADASKFVVDPATGALYFILPPDYEHPADSDHDNSYVVQVSASDGSLSDAQTLTITVTDRNDALLFVAAPADFGQDGKSDILWRNDSGAVALWTMNGAQKAADQVVSNIGNDWSLADTADFTGDGKADILWRHDSGAVALWTMNGAQKVADQVVSNIGNDWHLQKAADFSGDGKADILWRHDSGAVALWTMNGAQKIADQVVSQMGNDWHLAAAADFSGDGKADILWRHDNGTIAIWTMNGAQKAADQVVAQMDNSWKIADTADFNGDGKADILWRNDSGAIDVWTMNGAQKVADQFVSNMGNDWHVVDTADFNGDGKADILWRHDTGTVALWTMNGGQKAADQVVAPIGNDWHVFGLADVSGDGKADILWRHDAGTVALWTMSGAQKIADQIVSPMGHDWMLA
jgi:serralysin